MKKQRRGPITAAELMAKLDSDPSFVARRQEKDRLLRERVAQYRIEEAPLLDELRRVGLSVRSVWDLVNTSAKYGEVVPILLKHLAQPYSDKTREGIARALAVPEARAAWPTLVSEYRKAPPIKGATAKSGLAVALAATATDDVIDELIDIIKDRSHGHSRVLLIRALKRSKTPQAGRALEELASDPDLEKEIAATRADR